MSAIDESLRANELYALTFSQAHLPRRPRRRLAVLACMDCRIDVEVILGLRPGDAHVVRNAGAIVTEDVLRSLLISHHLLGAEEIMVIGHTECGMMGFKDDDLRRRLRDASGTAVVSPASFLPFDDLEQSVREQVQKLRSHPWVPEHVAIRGFVYEVETGRLREAPAQFATLSYDLPPLPVAIEEAE